MLGWAEQDLARREREEQKYLDSLPVCDCCGEPIQSVFTYVIDGENFCEDCAEEWLKDLRVDTERLVD